ncbi:SEC-C domain-containing protein [Streptomyces botrytidirepellens]|uniref:SEC-C domain-containing protein n=1 Tax=Streptomyces botrytidirepellens TaxID=2486417 RepID=A0A3M8WU59_9ACTN|nr:SEC-C domain-containing protein [Streptomyces botrytidirepellens]RNG33506.1 SEC-C domain-containing protein [Streptomyces botrytidirepellens]
MTGSSAHGDNTSPYDTFLARLGRKASAAECEQWARDHDSDLDVPRALIHAGWERSQAGAHAQALALLRRALERGGEQTRNAQVGIIEQLYTLGRTSEGHTARDALRAELDAATPPDLWIYNEMVELLSEVTDAQPQAALEWCEAALARAEAEECGEDAADHRQGLLINRSVVREQLGLEPDELDQAVEAEADRDALEVLGQLRDRLDAPLSDDGPVDGVVLRWTRVDFPMARRRWPETTVEYGDDYETYAAKLQRTAQRWSTSGAVRVRMVTSTLADYDAYVQHSGENPGDPETRIRYASWRAREFEQETLFWPPARNGPCWCESGRKYKKCCGDPARN